MYDNKTLLNGNATFPKGIESLQIDRQSLQNDRQSLQNDRQSLQNDREQINWLSTNKARNIIFHPDTKELGIKKPVFSLLYSFLI
jgi:hypothetical protein